MARPEPAPRPVGRPLKLLDDDTLETLLSALKMGVPISIACQGAGISETTFYRWQARGQAEAEVRERIAEDDQYVPDEDALAEEAAEQPYFDLYQQVTKARAAAALRNVGVIQKVAQGGFVTETTTRQYVDQVTKRVVTETVEKTATPDWRASAWYLERAHRGEFSKAAEQLEVSGRDGGPIQISAQEAKDLSERLAMHAAETAALKQIGAGRSDDDDDEDGGGMEILDADVVEEG